MTEATVRALAAGSTVCAYAGLCLAVYWRERRRNQVLARAAAALAGDGAEETALVLYASQTGQAEAIAWQTAGWLRAAGTPVRVMSLNEADTKTLRDASSALFIASTYGEGDAPDGASVFAEQVMGSTADFSSLRYAVLALGDRQYASFCGFGRALDEWLHSAGATRTFERLEVDNTDPASLAVWRARCGGDAVAQAEDSSAKTMPWRLAARERLNAGSAGAPVYHLAFVAPAGTAAQWESGDVAQITIASDPGRPRDYSISSIQTDGELQLLVRQEQHPDGTLGAASGLLTSTLAIGDTVALRLRPHCNFRLEGNAQRPLILIGNGTGLAGLRSHLRARAAARQHDNWLVFGERNARHDFLYRAEIEAWNAAGVLRRLDMVFSRDQPDRPYVQHRLLQACEEVLSWIGRGAAVYVCGSLQGMASGVDAALRQIAGEALVRELTATGRYRRDVY
ncbi:MULTISPECIES: sulfite reductase subunit alpha [unclassified Variovorax]|uniref:sulfite reductase subunit alpha n=1 Tax=unclassified Variovorax TaxID=663243 RepID=UPI003ECE9DAD